MMLAVLLFSLNDTLGKWLAASYQAGFAFLGSIMYAVFLTVARLLRGTPDVVMAFWQIGSSLVLGTFLTPFVFVPFARWYDLVLLSLLGLVSLGAIICVNRSLKL